MACTARHRRDLRSFTRPAYPSRSANLANDTSSPPHLPPPHRRALTLYLLNGAFLAVSAGTTAWSLYPATATRRTVDVTSPEAWRTRQWCRVVKYHTALLADHLAQDILAPASRAVCLGGTQEALAMRELEVATAIAVHKKCSPPLVTSHDTHLPFNTNSVGFVFAGRALDTAKRPADLAAKAARRGSAGKLLHHAAYMRQTIVFDRN
nr:uncharacterized protein LOC117855285 [Setaria viridis]